MSRPAANIPGYCTPCPSIGDRPAFLEKYRALKRAHEDDLAISPGSSLPSPPSYGPRSDNATENTADIPWPSPSTETIVTAIFRVLLTILTLFNVNITWRIHGKS